MREIDKLFLEIFKDLQISEDKNAEGKCKEPSFNCLLNNIPVSHRTVIGLIKRYQDELIEMLIKTDMGDNSNAQ